MELPRILREVGGRFVGAVQAVGGAAVNAVLEGFARSGDPVHGMPWLPHEPSYDADAAAAASVENFKQNNRVT